EMYAVDPAVGSVANNGPELIGPFHPTGAQPRLVQQSPKFCWQCPRPALYLHIQKIPENFIPNLGITAPNNPVALIGEIEVSMSRIPGSIGNWWRNSM